MLQLSGSPPVMADERIKTAGNVGHRVDQAYWMLWVFVGVVSLYDAWLVVMVKEVILLTEQNPMGRALIRLDPDGLTYFLTAKLCGTGCVLIALHQIHRLLRDYRRWIMGGVATFQAWLLFYLSVV